jgi:HK97 family phage major capsid protein
MLVPGDREERPSLRGGPGRTFAQLFPAALRSQGAPRFEHAGEFIAAVGRGVHDPRLTLEASSMSSMDDPSGGYAVPPDVSRDWLDSGLMEGNEIIRPRATTWPMVTRERWVPAFDVTDRSDGDIGGLTLQWESETGVMDLQVAKTRKIKLTAHKGAILAEVSNELLADGIGFSAQHDAGMRRALSYGLDRAFFYGVGGGQPLGIYASGALITVSKETGQAGGTILYENLLKMFARLLPSSVLKSVWVAHSSTIPQLAALTLPVGTGGAHIPVMTESDGSFRILTRPVIFTDKAKPLGQKGDIGLFDFSQYVVGLRAEIGIERSAHVGFTRDMMTFKLTIRIDGQPNIEAPYQLPDSAPTVSPFVALETRS